MLHNIGLNVIDNKNLENMIQIENRPPHDNTHQACNTPNPPWWCNDAPGATIDSGILIILIAGVVMGVVRILIKER